jgi:D-aminopeptidase
MMNHEGRRAAQLLPDGRLRIGGMPSGPVGAITDVAGVRVGHVTLVRGGPEDPPVLRTGVTAVLPHGGNLFREKVEAAAHVINGFGKSVGLPQVMELGAIESPILLTGTLNVWRVADALVDLLSAENPGVYSFNPVVCECNDSYLSDELARPVGPDHVARAVREARSGPVVEGCVGAGTGMSGFGYKAGIGTASRRLPDEIGPFTLGVLVLTNTGAPGELRIDGLPVGMELARGADPGMDAAAGSIIILVATDAPLSSRQLKRVARRAGFGLARAGAVAAHGSGDFVVAFSTTTRLDGAARERLPDDHLTPFFTATIEATEEAIVRSILRAETTIGRDGHVREAIPVERMARMRGLREGE